MFPGGYDGQVMSTYDDLPYTMERLYLTSVQLCPPSIP